MKPPPISLWIGELPVTVNERFVFSEIPDKNRDLPGNESLPLYNTQTGAVNCYSNHSLSLSLARFFISGVM